jgi:hypothetical protein
MIYVTYHKSNRVIVKSNLIFAYSILVGSICCFITQILNSLVATGPICTSKIWLQFLGYGFLNGGLLGKLNEMVSFYRTHSDDTVISSSRKISVLLIPVVMMQVIYLAIWQNTSTMSRTLVFSSDPSYVVYKCVADDPDNLLDILFLADLILMVLGCIIVTTLHKIISPYNEIRYILFSYINCLIISLIIIPFYSTSEATPKGFNQLFFLKSFGIIYVNLFIIIAIFGSKVFYIRKLKHEE